MVKEKSYVSIKMLPDVIPEMRCLTQKFEILCIPPDKGVHASVVKVARGGLRWSDLDIEDFRTEILG